jgi:hypothetical protein
MPKKNALAQPMTTTEASVAIATAMKTKELATKTEKPLWSLAYQLNVV